jgi:hypothetical protein
MKGHCVRKAKLGKEADCGDSERRSFHGTACGVLYDPGLRGTESGLIVPTVRDGKLTDSARVAWRMRRDRESGQDSFCEVPG